MSRSLSYVAGIAATAVLVAGAGSADARAVPPPRHVVYACEVAMIWRTPGHHPLGFLAPGRPFEITGYSPSGRWALGTSGFPGMRFREHGWVRRSHLCRTRPA